VGQVVTQDHLSHLAVDWKRAGKRVVAAAGAFDLLHPGHIRLLEQARSLGDITVVGVEGDDRVRAAAAERAKSRASKIFVAWPITSSGERTEILAALAAVDYAVELGPLSLDEWVLRLRPDVFVQGGFDNALHNPNSAEAQGCKVLHIPLEPGYSTIGLVEKIQQLPQ
jgi:rfaE bifunctional protein nucleotidyltransferase chain/domain